MAATLRALDYKVLQQCMHCGLCLPVCPTYATTKQERHSPRGRIALMRAVADEVQPVNPAFATEMYDCLGCLACQTACPAGVDYAQLIETARSDVELHRSLATPARRFWRTLTLRILFRHPRVLRGLGRLLRVYQRSGVETAVRKLRLTRLLPPSLRALEPLTPRMAPAWSRALIAPHESPSSTPRYRVALLTGCVQDLVFSDINRDTADVLLANDCAVHTPAVQPCCGSLHAHNGDLRTAAELARRLLDLLPPENYDAIISNAGGCGSHLRHFGTLLKDDPHYSSRATLWDEKLRDIHEWLSHIGCRAPSHHPTEPLTKQKITLLESCHLTHGQKITHAPRSLLALLPEYELVPLAESSWCCGSAGIYSITRPEESAQLLDRKIRHILASGAEIVAATNPGCHLQVARGLAERGLNIPILQPVSLLARAYRQAATPLAGSSQVQHTPLPIRVPSGDTRQ